MSKKRILLGVLIVMVMAVCSAWFCNIPSVFAAETNNYETIENEAGTFSGQGYYTIGEEAILIATMNPGYDFVAWISVDGEGNEIAELSDQEEYTFVVEENLNIKAKWSKIAYTLSFDESLMIDGILKDFDYQIVNNNDIDGNYYYNDQLQLTLTPKVYMYDLTNSDILINGTSIKDIIAGTNNMNIQCNIVNDETGFDSLIITLNIQSNIVININYTYMYKLEILSGNANNISEIIQFVTPTNYDAKLDDYNYLVREDKEITLTVSEGDDVYKFESYQFEGRDPDNKYSQSYVLSKDSTFTIYYSKKNYTISFNSYIINMYGEYDEMSNPLYNLADVSLTAGDQVEYIYDSDTSKITIKDITDDIVNEYDYPNNTYGYHFVGFAIANELLTDSIYTLSTTTPTNIEIQLIFEYEEYSFEIKLVDNYFADGVNFNYEYSNGETKLVTGTEITVYAETYKYLITGWSWIATPDEDDYVNKTNTYTFTFVPENNVTNYILYLDVDYKYTSITYSLKENNIEQNVEYDVIKVDLTNKKITFNDSEGLLISREVVYTDADITTDAVLGTIINAGDFGEIVILNDTLTYKVNDEAISSISKITTEGVDEYTFKKYTYFGDLQVDVIEYITLSESGEDVTVGIWGTTYNEGGTHLREIQTLTTTKTYNDEKLGYKINNFSYDMYLYMKDAISYDYIELRGVKYYYDGANFVLRYAPINIPASVEYSVVKDSRYSITLSNLLPNTLLVYSTNSTDALNYSFTSFTDSLGSGLINYGYDNYLRCILDSSSITQINVEYRKLENNITLNINNESAYKYEDISFTVSGVGGTGKTIQASDGENIIITISLNNISSGYKFDGFMFDGKEITDINNPTILEITMSNTYINQIIIICFSEINYTININYLDKDNNIVDVTDANGGLILLNQVEYLTSLSVVLSGQYELYALANTGYYVANAYIGGNINNYELADLISDNDSAVTTTIWKLNYDNFKQAIIDNADSENNVNLYIYFAVHTYSVKVYFEISENGSLITYPNFYINGTKAELNTVQEEVNGVITTRYCVQASGFEHGTNVRLSANNFMLGTRFEKWISNGSELPNITSDHTISTISKNTVLTMRLQYINYGIQFISVDNDGNSCEYGSVTDATTTAKLFSRVNYTIQATQGYTWKGGYYFDSTETQVSEGLASGFIFNPANFKIENSAVKIYMIFDVKEISITIEEVKNGTLEQLIGPWSSYTISRTREGIDEPLSGANYIFQTGDILVMELIPKSMGIEMNSVELGTINITTSTTGPYSLVAMNIVENNKVVGMYYKLIIEFTPSVVGQLEDDVVLKNILNVKQYNIIYTYNHIDYKFEVVLTRTYNGSYKKGGKDAIIELENVPFESIITFNYTYDGMNNEVTNNFKVVGYTIAGIKQETPNGFTLQDVSLWEEVALAKHIDGNNEISVVLIINPKITLYNYVDYNLNDGYIYEHTYIGANQGLIATGENVDIAIGANFNVSVQYSYDNGLNYSNDQPIDCGEYQVKITAQISATGKQTIYVDFDEKVTYKIIPAPLTLSLKTYSPSNPVTKIYDGTTNLASSVLVNDIVLNGVYERDQNKIFIDESRLTAKFTGTSVNSSLSLYNINVFNIYLLDSSNMTVTNYELSSGQNLVFMNIGKINPKELNITGFKVKDKVYDGTDEVVVDLSGVIYDGKIGTDSTQILTDKLKFYLDNYTVGVAREVKLDWAGALDGADSNNYTITYDTKYIDIYPYEISYTVSGYGTFKVVDEDRLCLIPIGAEMYARVYDRGSEEYRNYYSSIEDLIQRGENLKICYEVVLRIGVVNQLVPQGLYIYLPKVSKTTKVLQIVDNQNIENLEYMPQEDYTIIRAQEGEPVFTVITRTVYLPLWLIILIVCLSILLIAIIVLIFVLIRRKTKNKYKSYDRI